MNFRLFKTRNRPKQIFNRRTHAKHSVRFQFAEINNCISLIQILCVCEIFQYFSFRKVNSFFVHIAIQLCTELFNPIHARCCVDAIQQGERVRPAGAVAYRNICTACQKHFNKCLKQGRVGCCGCIGLFERNKVGFNNYFHSGLDKIQAVYRI